MQKVYKMQQRLYFFPSVPLIETPSYKDYERRYLGFGSGHSKNKIKWSIHIFHIKGMQNNLF